MLGKTVFLSVIVFSVFASGLEIELVSFREIPSKLKFQDTEIGGLSGILFDPNESKLIAVSDDKGKINEPRLYSFELTVANKDKIDLLPKEIIFIKGHSSATIDMEGITVLPWGNFLISTEGDNNKKPRIPPQILDVKKDGTVVRSFPVPDKYLPEATGDQKKGIANNRGFEGLTQSPSGKYIWTAHETPLAQEDTENFVNIIQYEMPEAWVLKNTKEFKYPLDKPASAFANGLSEILGFSESEVLVLERAATLEKKGLQYQAKLFLFDLKIGKKTLVYDFSKLPLEVQNFEGLSWGPVVDGKKTILVISDNNFKKSEKTLLLVFRIKEGKI